MNKKLILLSPPYQYKNKSLKWVAKSITVAPPLGLLYVAEAAKSVGWSVEIIDSEMEEYSLETAINKIISAAPDLIGITVTTPFLQSAIQASQGEGFKYYLQGSAFKYLWRYEHKEKPIQDLEKAKWFINKLIEITQERDDENNKEHGDSGSRVK